MPERQVSHRPTDLELADRLHSAAIHLLRRLRAEDVATGLSGPRLSALSVVVFGGPVTVTRLAELEQVKPPTISRMMKEMELEGLVQRVPDGRDRRVQLLRATKKGRRVLEEGRARRVRSLEEGLARLSAEERGMLAAGLPVLETLTRD